MKYNIHKIFLTIIIYIPTLTQSLMALVLGGKPEYSKHFKIAATLTPTNDSVIICSGQKM